MPRGDVPCPPSVNQSLPSSADGPPVRGQRRVQDSGQHQVSFLYKRFLKVQRGSHGPVGGMETLLLGGGREEGRMGGG